MTNQETIDALQFQVIKLKDQINMLQRQLVDLNQSLLITQTQLELMLLLYGEGE